MAKGCEPSAILRVVFLVDNTESLLSALRNGGNLPSVSAETWELAIDHKNLNGRDEVFNAAARPAARLAREDLVQRVPSFGYLVDRVRQELRVRGNEETGGSKG